MFQIQVAQTQRIICDRCGWPDRPDSDRSHPYSDTVEQARQVALEQWGFHCHDWQEGEARRELWLCPLCQAKAKEKEEADPCHCLP
jgi:hypothetical protein